MAVSSLIIGDSTMLNPSKTLSVSPYEIEERILFPEFNQLPKVVLILSPCRSGSNALCMSFGLCGYRCYSQPMKSLLRNRYSNQYKTWQIPNDVECIVVKETFGPFLKEESEFNPLAILRNLNYPEEKLSIISLFRDPFHTLSSWKRWWPEIRIDNFIKSYVNAYQIRQEAISYGIPTITYTYEILKNNKPSEVLKKLFDIVNLNYLPRATDWGNHPKFGHKFSNIHKICDPEEFIVDGIFCDVNNATKYEFVMRNFENLKLYDLYRIKKGNLVDIYNELKKCCEDDFKINIR